jgi:hypothetical protein
MVESVPPLEKSPAWSPAEKKELRRWFRQFLDWITKDKMGRQEGETENNHATWYDVQVVAIALYVDDKKLAKSVLEQSKKKRVARMIEPDGSQPQEASRTLSLGYTLFSLRAFFKLASLGEAAGVDLWNYQTKDGRGIRKALEYILPYFEEKNAWPGAQIKPLSRDDYNSALTLMRQGAKIYKDARLERDAEKVQAEIEAMPAN